MNQEMPFNALINQKTWSHDVVTNDEKHPASPWVPAGWQVASENKCHGPNWVSEGGGLNQILNTGSKQSREDKVHPKEQRALRQ